MQTDLPDGFTPHFRKSPVTNPWEPLNVEYGYGEDATIVSVTATSSPHTLARRRGGCIDAPCRSRSGVSTGATAAVHGD